MIRTPIIAASLLALAAGAFAAPDETQNAAEAAKARQERMDAAYRDHQQAEKSGGSFDQFKQAASHDAHAAGHAIAKGAEHAGHAVHEAASATGHAIAKGARATGHAIEHGAEATGHAIHKGVDKMTGKGDGAASSAH